MPLHRRLIVYYGQLVLITVVTALTFRYRARVAYNGAGFFGFQIQSADKEQRTVQETLENVLRQRFDDATLRVVGAGRTDTGVHARGQAIHINTIKEFNEADIPRVQYAIRKMLPNDVTLWNLQLLQPSFNKTINNKTHLVRWNVLYDSSRKWYSYRLCLGRVMDPMERHFRWKPPQVPTDTALLLYNLNKTLQCFVGTHDFAVVASGVSQKQRRLGVEELDTVRTVYAVEINVEDEDRKYYRIDFLLKGALYKQVRNMVGTTIDICCRNRGSIEILRSWLSNDDNSTRVDNRSKPAPPEGLTLEYVYFDNDPGF